MTFGSFNPEPAARCDQASRRRRLRVKRLEAVHCPTMLTWLAENALPIWMLGAIALTMAAIVYLQTRSRGAFFGVVGVLAVTALLLLVNRLIETPREAVERRLYEIAATVEANDVP